jgi:hypothetical protein
MVPSVPSKPSPLMEHQNNSAHYVAVLPDRDAEPVRRLDTARRERDSCAERCSPPTKNRRTDSGL